MAVLPYLAAAIRKFKFLPASEKRLAAYSAETAAVFHECTFKHGENPRAKVLCRDMHSHARGSSLFNPPTQSMTPPLSPLLPRTRSPVVLAPPAQPARRLEDILNETLKFSMPAVRAVLYLGLAILCFNVNYITVRQRAPPFVVSPYLRVVA